MMYQRGIYRFEVNEAGSVIYSQNNVELLRKLWLDRKIINFTELGPGDPGDFDYGAWHSACHLVAAGGVRKLIDGRLMWLEISYNYDLNVYYPTLTARFNNNILTIPLKSPEAKEYIYNSELLGFVEGTSEGRISARGILDNDRSFNNNPRQEYDQHPGDSKEGGKVWEHWCTTRDISETSKIGLSVLDSYLVLISACGEMFVSAVARGRTDYFHPQQLDALIKAGFISNTVSQHLIQPSLISDNCSLLLQEATPENSLIAIELLDWCSPLKYYMFKRSINNWNNRLALNK
ncbi:MAG TPA: hypothetical protein VFF33_13975 [Ignavibacteriaceae bacterium]|nr:hypothetical protein [Ignavibacteriaceae bacterium]